MNACRASLVMSVVFILIAARPERAEAWCSGSPISDSTGVHQECCCDVNNVPRWTDISICGSPMTCGFCCDPSYYLDCTWCIPPEEWVPLQDCRPPDEHGSCGQTCDDTELTDDYVNGVNVRTRCARTEVPMGWVDGGGEGFGLEVSIIYNEGRRPPRELRAGFPNTDTGPYGKDGWISVDRFISDEGIKVDDGGLAGTRRDANGNGYVGYTLHTPDGSRTYDYPLMLKVPARGGGWETIGAFRSEPFDGKFLRVGPGKDDDHTDHWDAKYSLFEYPHGPYEVYDHPLDPTSSVHLLSSIERWYGTLETTATKPRTIYVIRGAGLGGLSGDNHVVDCVRPFGIGGGYCTLRYTYGATNPDGGMTLHASQSPGETSKFTLTMTRAKDFRPDVYTSPGRLKDDETTFTWQDWRIRTMETKIRDKAGMVTFRSATTIDRNLDVTTIDAVRTSNTFLGVEEGERTVLFEKCNLSGRNFDGTTVTLPHDIRYSFEYEGAAAQHRLRARTDSLGTRTQLLYNGHDVEPRGELRYSVQVPEITSDAEQIDLGYGMQVEWDFKAQMALDATRFPAGTFVGMPASKGVPVPVRVRRRPDGLELRAMRDYADVFLPMTIVDERGLVTKLTYHDDTGQVKSVTRQGITTEYVRSVEKIVNSYPSAWQKELTLVSVEPRVRGAGNDEASLGKTSWDAHTGRFVRSVVTGSKLEPGNPTSGVTQPLKTEKRTVRDDDGRPTEVLTFVDDRRLGGTSVSWDARHQTPTGSTTELAGGTGPYASMAPGTGGAVDNHGGAYGNWQVTGPGQKLTTLLELDPLGRPKKQVTNELGYQLDYAASEGGLKTSASLVMPGATTPAYETVDFVGPTNPVCE